MANLAADLAAKIRNQAVPTTRMIRYSSTLECFQETANLEAHLAANLVYIADR